MDGTIINWGGQDRAYVDNLPHRAGLPCRGLGDKQEAVAATLLAMGQLLWNPNSIGYLRKRLVFENGKNVIGLSVSRDRKAAGQGRLADAVAIEGIGHSGGGCVL
jgi:hypothetical protein